MLIQAFKGILLMSAAGSLTAVILLCLAPVTRKLFSPRWQYYIWLTALIVMLLPVHFNIPSRTPSIPPIITEQAENIAAEIPQTDNQPNTSQSFSLSEKLQISKVTLPQSIYYYASNIWLVGILVILLARMAKYNLFLRQIHKNSVIFASTTDMPKRLNVRKTDILDAPLLVGLFKPTLFLPSTPISAKDMNYILMHELTHYKRGDILYKWLASAVQIIHWFNPFAYIVSRQIDTECEVSCDFAVTSKLSDSEKNDYMCMILDLLSRSKSSPRPLTTQMASSKNTIKRRFTMIRNKKATGKFVSAASVLAATALLATTVFASGILTDLTTDDYTIEISNNGEKITLGNKPFIENGEVYVPLRETLEKAMSKDEGVIDVKWDNGTINVVVAYYQGKSGKFQFNIGSNYMQLEHITYEDYVNKSINEKKVRLSLGSRLPTVLKNSVTYVPFRNVNYMLYSYANRRDENNNLRELDYIVYDKAGEIIASKSLPILTTAAKTSLYNNAAPEYAIDQFFHFFENGDFENMKKYCTANCVNTFFKNDSVFGMAKASLAETDIAPAEYAKASNHINAFVSVNIVPSEISVFDPSTTSTSFYVILEKQSDGGYLVDSFATGKPFKIE